MKRLFKIIKRKRNMRRLLAAALILIAFVDVGSRSVMTSGQDVWCAVYHYTNRGVDCPHKRDHRSPDKSSFEETTHEAVLLNKEELRITGIVYTTEEPTARKVRIVTRPLEPLFQPPKQT